MSSTQEIRSRAYARYKIGELDGTSEPYLRGLIKRYFPSDRRARIMDLGCGKGALLAQLRDQGYEYLFGVDVSPSQVEVCHDRKLTNVVAGDCLARLRAEEDGA